MATKVKSFLDLVRECDSLPYPDQGPAYTALTSTYYRFQLLETWSPTCSTLITVGYILPSTIDLMPWTSRFKTSHSERTVTIPYFSSPEPDPSTTTSITTNPSADPTSNPSTSPSPTPETSIIAHQLSLGHSSHSIPILQKWRNELYPILGITRTILIERSGSALFGIHTRGVHLMAYCFLPSPSPITPSTAITTSSDHWRLPTTSSFPFTTPSSTTPHPSSPSAPQMQMQMHLYIPTRSSLKQTFPLMLDTTVGGGISYPETPLQCLVREAAEEASLSEQLIREKAKATGTVSYFYVRDERAGGREEVGLLQPATQFLWDLEVRGGELPTAGRGEGNGYCGGEGQGGGEEWGREVEEFQLLSVQETILALREGRFKPNSAVCWIEFLVRHGFVTAETEGEREYRELVERMHRRTCF